MCVCMYVCMCVYIYILCMCIYCVCMYVCMYVFSGLVHPRFSSRYLDESGVEVVDKVSVISCGHFLVGLK